MDREGEISEGENRTPLTEEARPDTHPTHTKQIAADCPRLFARRIQDWRAVPTES